jgi:hypothetical protein
MPDILGKSAPSPKIDSLPARYRSTPFAAFSSDGLSVSGLKARTGGGVCYGILVRTDSGLDRCQSFSAKR